jgi:hypothetical protein
MDIPKSNFKFYKKFNGLFNNSGSSMASIIPVKHALPILMTPVKHALLYHVNHNSEVMPHGPEKNPRKTTILAGVVNISNA